MMNETITIQLHDFEDDGLRRRYTRGKLQGFKDYRNGIRVSYHPYGAIDCIWGQGYRDAFKLCTKE